MQTRKAIVAGQFYPGRHSSCVDEISQCLAEKTVPADLPETIVAGIVPHAGWTFSGALAAMVFSAIKTRHEKVDTFVIFGAAHSYYGPAPAVYDRGYWNTPLGDAAVDEDMAKSVTDGSTAVCDNEAHGYEHSIEVQIPFIQYLFPEAKILPILTPPSAQVISMGREVGDIIAEDKEKTYVCIGSTDLTHYGPRYGFTPMGASAEGLKWATEVNDKRFIDFALKLEPEKLLADSAENLNACGPGAAAAAITAAMTLGKTKGMLLDHTNSNKIMEQKNNISSSESVGYAAIII
ncbi:MAG: AmmeMemoRadiSam system protein B [Planctomycetota bacterium]|jgi:AmmeMemoRadiSam system protein B